VGSEVFLTWAGRNKDLKRPSTDGLCQLDTESEGDPDLQFIAGDNLEVLQQLGSQLRGQVTFIYLDPPFLTNKVHTRVRRTRTGEGGVHRSQVTAFDDRWPSLPDYLAALGERLVRLRDLLADHGSLVVHVDPKTSHYVKVLCDEVFGLNSFASEIIWRYRRWPAKTQNFQRVHDVLLRYVKNPAVSPRFNQLYEPLAPSTVATWGTGKQQAVVGKNGRRVRSSTIEAPSPGVPHGDVWDIKIVAPVATERTGYPTQKPEALLERLIEALSCPGDLVLDPYCGSGTSLSVAHRLRRKAVGIDCGIEAREVTLARLVRQGGNPTVRRLVTPAAIAASA
jgi:site-specific DNA-methyltransferase (adenine-specific)